MRLSIPRCTNCGKPIPPWERGTAFPCPNCGQAIIFRCKTCRKMGIEYRCPACGFTGP